MKKAFLLALFLSVVCILKAQAPANYYAPAEGLAGDSLKMALHEIIDDHVSYSYKQVWEMFAYTDCRADGTIWDMYSDLPFVYHDKQCGQVEMHVEGDCYNREHSWCQSWFGDSDGAPKSDMHHIYPVDGVDNSIRNNNPYGEVAAPTRTTANGSKLGPCALSGTSVTSFEPIDEYKGDIARGLFYMSVRYYGEDADWGQSPMTYHATLLPWAIEMLLRWSDNDPVSPKELARNNAVYGWQNNRNPFIDHPEYAHMIWDTDWTANTYFVTCDPAIVGGAVNVDDHTAYEGQIVTLYASPLPGYALDSWIVTDAQGNVINIIDDSFIMPASDVTVSATFVGDPTIYEITCAYNLVGGTISTNPTSALSGTVISLESAPIEGFLVREWYVAESATGNIIPVNNGTFIMPNADVFVTAVFNYYEYQKLTSEPEHWDGDYLIVYENSYNNADSRAFDGSLTTTLGNTRNSFSVSITDGVIPVTQRTAGARFTIADIEGGQSIRSASGLYIGKANDENGLETNASLPLLNHISINENGSNFDVVAAGHPYLRYNSASSGICFRYYKSSTYTNQKAIQLYELVNITATQPYTITYDGNGGVLPNLETEYAQTFSYDKPTQLALNQFTYEGYRFQGWSTLPDGFGQFFVDGTVVSVTSNFTLYAQWEPLYPVNLAVMSNGTVEAAFTTASEGEVVSLNALPAEGFQFVSWLVSDAEGHPITVIDDVFEMPASAVNVGAVFQYIGIADPPVYHLVTSTDELIEGRKYLLVGVSTNFTQALAETSGSENNRIAVDVAIDEDVINNPSTARELTLGISNGLYTFYDPVENGYLYAASSSNNQLQTQSAFNDNGRWSISIDETSGKATIVAQGTNTHNIIRFNVQYHLFSCYTSGQQDVYLYIKSECYDITTDTQISDLLPFDRCTVSANAKLTITKASSCNPAHIFVEDGGQLFTPSTDVEATFQKQIVPFGNDTDGWHFIASPVAMSVSTDQVFGLLSDSYDFYSFDQSAEHEWQNYKERSFAIANGRGYLYANAHHEAIEFTGLVKPTVGSTTINLDYDADATFPGFNLIGNPYSCNANIGSVPFYVCNGNEITLSDRATIKPCEAVFVQAAGPDQSVTFVPGDLVQTSGAIVIEVHQGRNVTDRTQICIAEHDRYLQKITMSTQSPKLYVRHDDMDYAAFNVQPHQAFELPICFEPQESGSYTLFLTIPEAIEGSLHLIDMLTGTDMNLLGEKSACYTFNATMADIPSRFMLVYKP